jgi:hypothetical protein
MGTLVGMGGGAGAVEAPATATAAPAPAPAPAPATPRPAPAATTPPPGAAPLLMGTPTAPPTPTPVLVLTTEGVCGPRWRGEVDRTHRRRWAAASEEGSCRNNTLEAKDPCTPPLCPVPHPPFHPSLQLFPLLALPLQGPGAGGGGHSQGGGNNQTHPHMHKPRNDLPQSSSARGRCSRQAARKTKDDRLHTTEGSAVPTVPAAATGAPAADGCPL